MHSCSTCYMLHAPRAATTQEGNGSGFLKVMAKERNHSPARPCERVLAHARREQAGLSAHCAGEDTPLEYITDSIWHLLEKQRLIIEEDLARGGYGDAPDLAALFEREYPEACAPVSALPSPAPVFAQPLYVFPILVDPARILLLGYRRSHVRCTYHKITIIEGSYPILSICHLPITNICEDSTFVFLRILQKGCCQGHTLRT
jgi:hypothetical protein